MGEPCTACCLCVAPEYGLPPKSFYFIGAVVRVEALNEWTPNADQVHPTLIRRSVDPSIRRSVDPSIRRSVDPLTR